MEPNFWNWVLTELVVIIRAVLAPLFGGYTGMQSAAQFIIPILDGSYITFDMVYTFFGAFNLTFVGAYFASLIWIALAKGTTTLWFAIINTIAKVKSLIPIIG